MFCVNFFNRRKMDELCTEEDLKSRNEILDLFGNVTVFMCSKRLI